MTSQNCFRKKQQKPAGFSLVEAMVYLALWAVVTGFAFSLFYRSLSTHQKLRENVQQLARVLQVGERWRDEVRRAVMPIPPQPPGAPHTLLVPTSQGGVSYRFLPEQALVQRWSEAGSTWETVLKEVADSRMLPVSRGEVKGWRWEISLMQTQKVLRVRPAYTFMAVRGGKNIGAPGVEP